jgi:N-acetylglucosaminyl-diphospho-decaprenol L-rhamnosyltransferase
VPDVAIVIVNYNTVDLLCQCLRSVYDGERICSYDVLVVDNHSDDHSAETVERLFPRVLVARTPRNGGYAYANNIALRFLAGEETGVIWKAEQAIVPPSALQRPLPRYVLLLNPDTVLPPGTLQRMVEFMDSRPEIGAAGPKLVRGDGRLDLACRRSFPTPLNALFKLTGLSRLLPRHPVVARYNMTYADEDRLTEVDSVCGAFMLVRSQILREVGYLDERFFMYGEDLDWAYRIKQRGWRVFYNPSVVVQHLKGESSKKQSNKLIIEFYRAMYLFHRKHYAPREPLPLTLLVWCGIVLKGASSLARNAVTPAAKRRVA